MSNNKYNIGYGKPPKENQFSKGKSGNPKGRPKGSRNTYKMLEELLSQKVPVIQDGKTIRISKKKAILLQAVNPAVKGDLKAITTILPHMIEADARAETMEKTKDASSQTDKKIIEQFLKDRTGNGQENS